MKILIIPNNLDTNCYGVRNGLPAEFLRERGHEVRIQQEFKQYKHPVYGMTIDPVDIDWSDVVIFNRHYDTDSNTVRNLMRYAKSEGKKVIYETDDLLESLDMSNPMYASIQEHVSQVRMMTSEADLCTTTGAGLANELLKYNPNVAILPNCIDTSKWTLRKGKNKKVKVGWAGGSSHMEDLLEVIDVIIDLQKEIDFEFVIFGLAPQSWDKYIDTLRVKHMEQTANRPGVPKADWYAKTEELAVKLEKLKWTHIPFVPLEKYNQTLAAQNFDIGLCPLKDTRFNRSKSAIKFYEYAMVGTATLSSKIPPYAGEVGYEAKNYDQWGKKLKRLIEDKDFRAELTKKQRNWVFDNRNIITNINLWEKAYGN